MTLILYTMGRVMQHGEKPSKLCLVHCSLDKVVIRSSFESGERTRRKEECRKSSTECLCVVGMFFLCRRKNLQTCNKTLYWTYSCLYLGFCEVDMCIGLHGKVLVAGRLQECLLWEAAGSFPHVWQTQCQPALRPSAMVVILWDITLYVILWDNVFKKAKLLGRSNCSQGSEDWEYVRKTALQTPKSAKKEGEDVFQVLELRFPCSPWCSP